MFGRATSDSVLTNKPFLERAFELARGGKCLRWQDVANYMAAEGYELVTDYFSSPGLRRDIDATCAKEQ